MRLPNIFQFEAFGTNWSIESDKKIDANLRDRISKLLDKYEREFSRFRRDSKVFQMSQETGAFRFDGPLESEQLFDFYEQLFEVTNGAVSPLIGDSLRDAGYDEDYQLTSKKTATPPPNYHEFVSRKRSELTLKTPMMFDVGAAGKGHAVDLLANLMRTEKYANFVIDASGDIRICGNISQTIGLEHPQDSEKVIGTVELKNAALCASGTNRRAWANLHHVFDARTAQPTEKYVATWAIADSAMIADGCATALFFLENPRDIEDKFNISFIRITKNGDVETSENIDEKGVTLFS